MHKILRFVGNVNDINGKANDNNIIFTIKDTNLYVSAVTLSATDNQKLSKHLSKGFEISVCWNEYKTKSENKAKTKEYRQIICVRVNRISVLVYLNRDNDLKRFKTRKQYLPKGIIKNYNVIINRKSFYDQTVGFDMKRYEEIRKLTIEQGEDYTTGCLLDYDYLKNQYKLIAIDLSRQKELDTNHKVIQQLQFF